MLTRGLSGRDRYLQVNDSFHRKVVEGTEPWVRTRTPDDAGAPHARHPRSAGH